MKKRSQGSVHKRRGSIWKKTSLRYARVNGLQRKVLELMRVVRAKERASLLLQERASLFLAFLETGPAMGFIKDEAGCFLYYNRLFCERFAVSSSEWLGKSVFDLFPAEFARGYHEADMAVLSSGQSQIIEETSPGPHDSVLYWRTHKFPIFRKGAAPLLGALCLDVSSERHTVERLQKLHIGLLEANEKLTELSLTDGLTGLHNRRAFDSHAQNLLLQHQPACLLLIDVDHFKKLNDTYGHVQGDCALKGLAMLLIAACRTQDFVARLGGEEFAVLLSDVPLEEGVDIAMRVRQQVESFAWCGPALTVSIGVTSLHCGLEQTEQAIARADSALYRAKRDGRNRVCSTEQQHLIHTLEVPAAGEQSGLLHRSTGSPVAAHYQHWL